MTYYVLCALLTVLGFPFVVIPLWIRYQTLRYKIDDDGISTKWGFIFRREVYVTYRRIQDIHVTRNLLERWLGLAKISLQTASGSSQAELVIEGTKQPEAMRDFLYARMRGARNDSVAPSASASGLAARSIGQDTNESPQSLQLLTEIRDALREIVDQRGGRS
jgi:putative membrane protein